MVKHSKPITMSRDDFFAEHKKLIELLSSTAQKLGKEAASQAKEAKSYKGGMLRRRPGGDGDDGDRRAHLNAMNAARHEGRARKVTMARQLIRHFRDVMHLPNDAILSVIQKMYGEETAIAAMRAEGIAVARD